jgi:5-methylcytosine-specific restriction protein A
MDDLNYLRPKTRQTVAQILGMLELPKPSTNYDWCFGKASETSVMFQWFDQIVKEGDRIQFIETSEQWAKKNQSVAEPVQLNRAAKVHSLVLSAYVTKRPIHVAIVDGESKFTPVGTLPKRQIKETGQAKYRVLDNELWWPHHRDPVTQQIVVVRGVKQPDNYDPLSDSYISTESEPTSSADQDPSPRKRESNTTIYDRDSTVVREAKERASTGHCEYCGEIGFETSPEKYYLEAHHVIPISKGGPDTIWNIAVLCANDHRQAHFGRDRAGLRIRFIEMLGNIYPSEKARLIELAKEIAD